MTRDTLCWSLVCKDFCRTFFPFLSIRGQPVADAPDGFDHIAGRSQLLTQGADMDIDGPGLPVKIISPDLLQQRVPGEDDAPLCHQIPAAGRRNEE